MFPIERPTSRKRSPVLYTVEPLSPGRIGIRLRKVKGREGQNPDAQRSNDKTVDKSQFKRTETQTEDVLTTCRR